jgi:hypothetical protein
MFEDRTSGTRQARPLAQTVNDDVDAPTDVAAPFDRQPILRFWNFLGFFWNFFAPRKADGMPKFEFGFGFTELEMSWNQIRDGGRWLKETVRLKGPSARQRKAAASWHPQCEAFEVFQRGAGQR